MAKISSLLLLPLVVTAIMCIFDTVESSDETKFIEESCTSTTYPELCIESLSMYASTIQHSPRQLARTALDVSLTKAQSAQKFVTKLGKFKGLKKREYEAIEDCLDEMGDTVERLNKSILELTRMGQSKSEFSWHMSNVETWVSAALTDENTCLDGFSEKSMEGQMKTSVRAHVLHVAQVTSNALALVNNFAAQY